MFAWPLPASLWFQSTLPRGERRDTASETVPGTLFQSTLPRGERLCMIYICPRHSCFNPRSHEGSDIGQSISLAFARQFHSTLPRGERQTAGTEDTPAKEFQSTLPRGERHKAYILFLVYSCFNPRSHEGSDIKPIYSSSYIAVSIHAPTRGATAVLSEEWTHALVSIHAPTRGATM